MCLGQNQRNITRILPDSGPLYAISFVSIVRATFGLTNPGCVGVGPVYQIRRDR